MRVRTVWVLLGLLCAAVPLYAQPPSINTTNGLQSQLPGGEGGPFGPLLGPAITTGTPNAANTGFFLVINGTNFSTEYFDHVQWADPIVGNCEIYFGDQACDGAYIYNVTATQVVVLSHSVYTALRSLYRIRCKSRFSNTSLPAITTSSKTRTLSLTP